MTNTPTPRPTAGLRGYVWNDAIPDGIQQYGEPGIQGVTVTLFDSSNMPVASTTTNAMGQYLFTGLDPGDYSVEFTAPPGTSFSPQNQGGNPALDSDANQSTGHTILVTLVAGPPTVALDAGVHGAPRPTAVPPTPTPQPTAVVAEVSPTATPTPPCKSNNANRRWRDTRDCGSEWCTDPLAPPDSRGLVENPSMMCTDDDPTCDFGASPGDRTCTFHVALCFNNSGFPFRCNWGGAVAEVKIDLPSTRGSQSDANRQALEDAFVRIGAKVRGKCANLGPKFRQYCVDAADCDSAPHSGNGQCTGRFIAFVPPLSVPDVCTSFADVKVPIRNGGAFGATTYRLRITVQPPNDPVTGERQAADKDTLDLVCISKPDAR